MYRFQLEWMGSIHSLVFFFARVCVWNRLTSDRREKKTKYMNSPDTLGGACIVCYCTTESVYFVVTQRRRKSIAGVVDNVYRRWTIDFIFGITEKRMQFFWHWKRCLFNRAPWICLSLLRSGNYLGNDVSFAQYISVGWYAAWLLDGVDLILVYVEHTFRADTSEIRMRQKFDAKKIPHEKSW